MISPVEWERSFADILVHVCPQVCQYTGVLSSLRIIMISPVEWETGKNRREC